MLIKLSPRPPKPQSGSIPQVYGVEADWVRGGDYLVLSRGAINRAQIFHRVESSAKALVNAVVIVNFDATGL
jgi:hypothetical protein